MENDFYTKKQYHFHGIKIAKKEQLTKNTFALELEIPKHLEEKFTFQSGQYVAIKYDYEGKEYINEYSMTSAPHEGKMALGIKVNTEESSIQSIINKNTGDVIQVSEPQGRFVLATKPHEFRTILGFAGGIGITPILSHIKNILYTEPRTRFFLFYGNKNTEDIAFKEELDILEKQYSERLQIFYFLSQEKTSNFLLNGRIDEKKVELIINQILHLDDTDEESTIWDAVDEVLICGKGDMIKSIANACYNNGIQKRNIHFELFYEFNEDIFPQEKEFPLVENIQVEFLHKGKIHSTTLENNKQRLLQQLLIQKYPLPYSCKSGICGICECKLEEGEVELLENEYLTQKEEEKGHILACMSVVLSDKIKVNFDLD